MGVPGFFSWLLRNYKKNTIITDKITKDIDTLYIDANCLFHPQCFQTLDTLEEWSSVSRLETKMINRILKYINYLIEYTKTKHVYIAVDGVAPMAKMSQQRKRRYKSNDELNDRDKIKEKNNKPIKKRWSNSVITPGTEFMEKLHLRLLKYISTLKIKATYSSYHTNGEGEHKILNDIKTNDNNDNIVIYGLDADLIFLALASNKSNIYLLRESSNFKDIKIEQELSYVSIDQMEIGLYETLKDKINIKNFILTKRNLVNDFIFVCYFLGNDFLPHLPSIDIIKGGLDLLLNSYSSTINYQKKYLFDENKEINTKFLFEFIKYISLREDYYFKKILPKYKYNNNKKTCKSDDKYICDVWEYENLKNINIKDEIKFGVGLQSEWKERYYQHYFNSNKKELINNICLKYLEGLKWTTEYYFKGCQDWCWQYDYVQAPFISDIFYYLKNTHFDINKLVFDQNIPLKPCEQLLAVMPPPYVEQLPKKYQQLVLDKKSPIKDLYPIEYELDYMNKDLLWKCEAKLPFVDDKRIRESIKNIKLSKKESIRNLIYDEFTN
jgi:5'-3' exonuclease